MSNETCFERSYKEVGITIEVMSQLLAMAITHSTQHCNRNWKSKLTAAGHKSFPVATQYMKALMRPFVRNENKFLEHP